MKNNPVFQVLVVTNPEPFTLRDGEVTDLGVGQLGVFDASTNKVLNLSRSFEHKDIYLAVGVGDADGNLVDIVKSAGESINLNRLISINVADYKPAQNQSIDVDLSSFQPVYGSDYVARFNFMSGQTMNLNGTLNPVKSFVVTTPSNDIGNFDLDDFIDLLVAEVNKDEEQLVVASRSGQVVTFAIGSEDKEYVINGINKRYNGLRQFSVQLALSAGFETDGTFTIVNNPAVDYEQGSGYDIQQLEYVAGGWIGNPGVYRDSNLNGVLANQIKILSKADEKYVQVRCRYNPAYTSGGSLDYNSVLETVLALPASNDNGDILDLCEEIRGAYAVGTSFVDEITQLTTSTTTTTTTTSH